MKFRRIGLGLLLGLLPALCVLQSGCVAAADQHWESLLPAIVPSQAGVGGSWRKSGDELTVSAAPSARLALPVAPRGEYDLRASFTRRSGHDSIGLIVVQGGRQVVFEVDAWGSHLAGFQNISGRSIKENPTRRENYTLQNGRRYTMTVEVRKGTIRGLLDGKEVANYATQGADLSLPDLWSLPDRGQLGLVAWQADTTFHTVETRLVSGSMERLARAGAPAPAAAPAPTPQAPRPAARPAGRRVLMVIASHHFFFREYGDPRSEFDRAGFRVTVAASRRGACDPHPNSGQSGSGTVQADIAVSEARASDYDALLFSGGWGASMYQYAFPGRYNDPSYNGDRAVKEQVNRLIGEFIAQDKYVGALCNGTSVLAWARVNGRSPLAGKRVCAPMREAAPGIYNGRQASPPCRWHAEVNGALLMAPGSVGQPGTAADDVMVDGKILTGEDDISAREMGRRIVALLSR